MNKKVIMLFIKETVKDGVKLNCGTLTSALIKSYQF